MPVLDVDERVEVDTPSQPKDPKPAYPLAGAQLLCPYCGWSYEPEQGCFCVRIETGSKAATR